MPQTLPPELKSYSSSQFSRGVPRAIEAMWILTQWLLVSSWIPGSSHRRFLLRLFGARVGIGVIIRPRVRVKFPWRLIVGDYSWIGEGVWIDNLAVVDIGSNACISQGAYLCTGSHDWSTPTFDLITKPIIISDGSWISANSTVGPGVKIGEGAVLGLGSTTSKDLDPWGVYNGSPAAFVKRREINLDKPKSVRSD